MKIEDGLFEAGGEHRKHQQHHELLDTMARMEPGQSILIEANEGNRSCVYNWGQRHNKVLRVYALSNGLLRVGLIGDRLVDTALDAAAKEHT